MVILNKEELKDITVDEYRDLCERADCCGLESLTENEQYIITHWSEVNGVR